MKAEISKNLIESENEFNSIKRFQYMMLGNASKTSILFK
jgi:hypothetical protein